MTSPPVPLPHLRRREGDEAVTALELFFDLVFVLAITQLSHLVIGDQTAGTVARAGVLLVVVWWGWINTTWMVNRFDPSAPRVRLTLLAAMLVSLLMAAAVPSAFGAHGLLFAAGYVALQVGRNLAAVLLLPRGHAVRPPFARLLAWSVLSAPLWLAGSALDGDTRLWLWLPALTLDLVAPFVGYRTPGLGASSTLDFDIDGGHFAERCQLFVILALGESIVVTGATAQAAGLDLVSGLALSVAFLGTGAMWWLYFGEVAERSRHDLSSREDTARLARDAFTFLHVPIVAGIILAAVGDDLVLAHPREPLHPFGALMVLGGPALFLVGESLFRWRMVHSVNPGRLTAIVSLALLIPVAAHLSGLLAGAAVVVVLACLAVWEGHRGGVRPASPREASG